MKNRGSCRNRHVNQNESDQHRLSGQFLAAVLAALSSARYAHCLRKSSQITSSKQQTALHNLNHFLNSIRFSVPPPTQFSYCSRDVTGADAGPHGLQSAAPPGAEHHIRQGPCTAPQLTCITVQKACIATYPSSPPLHPHARRHARRTQKEPEMLPASLPSLLLLPFSYNYSPLPEINK